MCVRKCAVNVGAGRRLDRLLTGQFSRNVLFDVHHSKKSKGISSPNAILITAAPRTAHKTMPPRLFSRRPAPPRRPYSTARTPSRARAPPTSPPPPRPSYFTLQALYPFLLLSTMTSLALNLSHSRATQETETSHLRAQISVLESVLRRLTAEEERAGEAWTKRRRGLSPEEQETVERELELVGLGRGKNKDLAVGGGNAGGNAGGQLAGIKPVAWAEVFFGKKGKEWEVDTDDTDWEKGAYMFVRRSSAAEDRWLACSIPRCVGGGREEAPGSRDCLPAPICVYVHVGSGTARIITRTPAGACRPPSRTTTSGCPTKSPDQIRCHVPIVNHSPQWKCEVVTTRAWVDLKGGAEFDLLALPPV